MRNLKNMLPKKILIFKLKTIPFTINIKEQSDKSQKTAIKFSLIST